MTALEVCLSAPRTQPDLDTESTTQVNELPLAALVEFE
jgi:hypothetical protein